MNSVISTVSVAIATPTTRRGALGWMTRSAAMLAGVGAAVVGLPQLALAGGPCTGASGCTCYSVPNGTITIGTCGCGFNSGACSGNCGSCPSRSPGCSAGQYAVCCPSGGAYCGDLSTTCTGSGDGGCTDGTFCTQCTS